jgi:superoxide reductase
MYSKNMEKENNVSFFYIRDINKMLNIELIKGGHMTKRNEVYKCSVCGNIVQMNHASAGTLVCCEKEMELLEELSADSTTEKHVPVIEKIDGGYKVTVGSTLHPMTDAHYIEWIELLAGDDTQKVYLKPGDTPEAVFKTDATEVTARSYCNLHSFWKS